MTDLPLMLALAPVMAPGVAAAGYTLFGWRRATVWLGAATTAVLLGSATALAVRVVQAGPGTAAAGLVRVDALSAYMLVVIGAVALLATAATPAHLAREIAAGRATCRTAARHNLLVALFTAAMASAVLAANLGALWVAVEATTIATAFLVGQRRTRGAVEAAWKYVVICSTGIALALLGTLILNYAAGQAGRPDLSLTALTTLAPGLDPSVTRVAVTLLIIGFATKVGLVPLHAWLPDAHSQAPAPVSALMSGVLLSVAFYAVLRVKHIADIALGPAFARTMLLVMALATLAVAATLLISQRDYKRMLAYSSMEHMGLLAFGAAIGSRLALASVLLHVLGHGLAKATLFLGSGRILQITGSSRIDDVRGLNAGDPALAGCVGLGLLALLGLPPFSLFASELGIFRAAFAAGHGWTTALVLVLVVVAGGALAVRAGHLLLGDRPSPPTDLDAVHGDATAPARRAPSVAGVPVSAAAITQAAPVVAPATARADRTSSSTIAVLLMGLLACAVLGLAAAALQPLLYLAADAIR